MRIVTAAALLFSLVGLAEGDREGRAKDFQAANAAVDAGNYAQAIPTYQALLAGAAGNSVLWYDLGVARFRNGELGCAIHAFRRAAELAPRDPDVRFNLEYARKKATDRVDDKRFRLASLFPVSEKEAYAWLALAAIFFWGTLAAHAFFPRPWLVWTARALGVVFVVALLGVGGRATLAPFGVVTTAEAEVRSGGGKDSALLFTLHAGTEFDVAEKPPGDWLKIELADGKRGWIRKSETVF